jgi:hypothetical protein
LTARWSKNKLKTASTPGLAKPDFARYSQEQLKQISTRLNAARYPERAREVELRLAALNASSRDVAAAPFPMGERKRISSNTSLVLNKLFPFFCACLGLLFFISFIFSNEKPITGLWVLMGLFVLGMLGQLATGRLTEEVFLMDEAMLLIRADQQELVPLASIASVDVVDREGVTVVLDLSAATRFGQRIEFVPANGLIFNPFKEIPAVQELRARIASAKARAAKVGADV